MPSSWNGGQFLPCESNKASIAPKLGFGLAGIAPANCRDSGDRGCDVFAFFWLVGLVGFLFGRPQRCGPAHLAEFLNNLIYCLGCLVQVVYQKHSD